MFFLLLKNAVSLCVTAVCLWKVLTQCWTTLGAVIKILQKKKIASFCSNRNYCGNVIQILLEICLIMASHWLQRGDMECKSTEHLAYVPKPWKNSNSPQCGVFTCSIFSPLQYNQRKSTIATLGYLKWRIESWIPALAVFILVDDGK